MFLNHESIERLIAVNEQGLEGFKPWRWHQKIEPILPRLSVVELTNLSLFVSEFAVSHYIGQHPDIDLVKDTIAKIKEILAQRGYDREMAQRMLDLRKLIKAANDIHRGQEHIAESLLLDVMDHASKAVYDHFDLWGIDIVLPQARQACEQAAYLSEIQSHFRGHFYNALMSWIGAIHPELIPERVIDPDPILEKCKCGIQQCRFFRGEVFLEITFRCSDCVQEFPHTYWSEIGGYEGFKKKFQNDYPDAEIVERDSKCEFCSNDRPDYFWPGIIIVVQFFCDNCNPGPTNNVIAREDYDRLIYLELLQEKMWGYSKFAVRYH